MRIFISVLLLLSSHCFASSYTAKPGTVALTFDDGPSPNYTPKVLAILKKYDIKATFFVMGQYAKKHPDLIRQIANEGHAVALHSMTHPKLTKISMQKLRYEISEPKNIVKAILNKTPICLRPPFGMSNQRLVNTAKTYDIQVVPMGFNSFDYQNRGSEKLSRWVINNARSGQVILLHDGYRKRGQTVKALPDIIEGIRKKGLSFSAFCYPQ